MSAQDPYAALRHPPYRLFLLCSQAMHWGNQAAAIGLGWHLYEKTGSAWVLGLIGLANYLPIFLFSLPAGWLADRIERRRILAVTLSCQCLSALGLAYLASRGGPLAFWYFLIFAAATSRAVQTPAAVAFYPSLLPRSAVANAVAWQNSNFQISAIGGPVLGGLLLQWGGPTATFIWSALGPFFYLCLLPRLKPLRPFSPSPQGLGLLETLTSGLRFIHSRKVLLSSLSLDMIAVLFGGAEAILPMFAKDILAVGPVGLGFLRSAGFAGSLVTGIYLAHRPLRWAGYKMLWAVAGFGLSMLLFGLSTNYLWSLFLLFSSGICDGVSVVVRQTMVQLYTPERLRGRVQSVNFLFVGSSNELGEFESGVTAAWWGPVGSVLVGGVVTILAVLVVHRIWPELGRLDRLNEKKTRES